MTDLSSGVLDPARLAALRDTSLLDGPPIVAFDRLTHLAARSLRASEVLISLVDGDRQFFASTWGVPQPWAAKRETPLSMSFCRYVVERGEPLAIVDARFHPLVCDSPAIEAMGIVAYLGLPLVTPDGHVLGTFCAIDREPRVWTGDDIETVRDLAALVMAEVEHRKEIASRERAVAALRESEMRYRILFESNPHPMWVFDVETLAFLAVNEATLHYYGYSREILGMTSADIRPPEDLPKLRERLEQFKEAAYREEGIWRHRHKDGRLMEVEVAAHAIEFEGRKARVVLAHDVTARNKALRDLRESQERYERAAQAGKVGVWEWDIVSGEFFLAPNLKRMLGYSEDELPDRTGAWGLLMPKDDEDRAFEALQEHLDGNAPVFEVELRRRHKDGTFRWFLARGTAIRDPDGRPIRMTGSDTDITDHKKAEAMVRQAKDQAEAASRSKDEFLAALSHELRTPLTPVLMSISSLLEEPETPPELRPVLEVARRNVELEARLIDDLLDVTRIARGKLHLDRRPVDAHALIRQTVEICHNDIATARLVLRLDLSAERHHVLADPGRFQQVVWNLIKNAVKFSPGGGLLAIRTRNESPAVPQASGKRLVVEVRDTGIGIEPELISKIFHAFEQGGAGVTRQFGGLGLGLAISRSLAEAHDGNLSAASAGRGQGATFTLDLPSCSAKDPRMADPAPTADPASQPSTLSILLVEDNADTLRLMARLLRARGHRVTAAASVAEALEAAGHDPALDLLISDIGLPDGSGLDLIRQIQSRRPIRGIALSGFGMDCDLRRSSEAGFLAHLTKPIDVRRLDEVIGQVTPAIPHFKAAGPDSIQAEEAQYRYLC